MYAKLFTSIYQGTLRGKSHALLVFTNLIAHSDARGEVDIHPRAISEEVGLSIDEVKAALIELEAPDIESRSPDEEGRRIIRLDEHRSWGWRIVNYLKYRAIRDEGDRREQNRAAQDRWRNKNKPASATVSQQAARKPESAQAEAEAEAEAIHTAPARVVGGAALRAAPPPPFDGSNIEALNGKSVVILAVAWELPEAWGVDAEALGWKPGEVLKEAEKFRQYWTAGKGQGTRRSVKGWRQTWSNWLDKAAKDQR